MGIFDFLKKPEEILAVHRDSLFGKNKEFFFDGFIPKNETGYENRIIENGVFLLRHSKSEEQALPAEKDERFKQVIPYSVIRQGNKYFVYKRTKKGNESRLHEKYSLGVGGHINPLSMRNINKVIENKEISIIDYGMVKELEEEIHHKEDELDYNIIGYINHEGNEVSRVHFGVVYMIRVKDDIDVREKHKLEGKMMSKEEIAEIQDKFEEWSSLVWKHLLLNG